MGQPEFGQDGFDSSHAREVRFTREQYKAAGYFAVGHEASQEDLDLLRNQGFLPLTSERGEVQLNLF
jgi:hypothetical protein